MSTHEFSENLARALLHSTWQGACVVAGAAMAATYLRRAPARHRYAVLLVAEGLIFAAFLITFFGPTLGRMARPSNALHSSLHDPRTAPNYSSQPGEDGSGVAVNGERSSANPARSRYVAIFYLCGVSAMLLRLLVGIGGGNRMVQTSKPIAETRVLVAIAKAVQAMEFAYTPAIAYCSSVVVPSVVGVLRPTLLLPFSVATGLSSSQLEVLVMHELAHIRRHDPIINLLQRLVEAFLFYHPLIWYLAFRIRDERELCCDDMVVQSGGPHKQYAESLLRMAEMSLADPISAVALVRLAATGKRSSLRRRIVRLLHDEQSPPPRLQRTGAIMTGSLAITAALGSIAIAMRQPAGSMVASSPATTQVANRPTTSIGKSFVPLGALPLHAAAAYGTLEEIAMHLREGTNPNVRHPGGWAPLHYAAAMNRRDAIRALVAAGAEVNAQNEQGRTALHSALGLGPMLNGRERVTEDETVAVLLSHGGNPNVPDIGGLTPLHNAVLQRRTASVDAMLKSGAQVNLRDGKQRTSLHHACTVADEGVVKMLLDYGADAQAIEERGWSTLDMLGIQTRVWTAELRDQVDRCATLLLAAGAQPDLTTSVALGLSENVTKALDADPSLVNKAPTKTIERNSLLHWAALSGNAEMCRMLIRYGADVNARNSLRRGPLDLAVGRRAAAVEAVVVLLESGAPVNPAGSGELSPLQSAVLQASPEIVSLLLRAGAKADLINSAGQTLLHTMTAADGRNPDLRRVELADLLIKAGSDLNHPDKTGATPLHLAVAGSRAALVNRYLTGGSNPNAVDQSGRTPLLIAVASEPPNISIVQALVEHGADPNLEDTSGRSPVEIASDAKNPTVSSILLKNAPNK